MDFKDVVNKRYSMRHFKPTDVPQDKIREIIDIAKLAPSAGNLQSYKVIISKEKVAPYDAPLYLVICADLQRPASRYGERGKNLYAIQDATIFAAYLQLAAIEAGLASCWVGAFREGKLKRQLNIPESLKPVAIICLGHPIGEKSGRKRRSFEDIIWSGD